MSELKGGERISYANPEFEKLSGQLAAEVEGKPWSALAGKATLGENPDSLADAIVNESDFIGTFSIGIEGEAKSVDAYSNVIEDDDGISVYRLAALVDISTHEHPNDDELSRQLSSRDAQLQEIQHRVKNNLQMITALIRIEARNARGRIEQVAFDRLVGTRRIDRASLQIAVG